MSGYEYDEYESYETPEDAFVRLADQLGYEVEEPEDPRLAELRAEMEQLKAERQTEREDAFLVHVVEDVERRLDAIPNLSDAERAWVVTRALDMPFVDGLIDVEGAHQQFREVAPAREAPAAELPLDASDAERVAWVKDRLVKQEQESVVDDNGTGRELDLDKHEDRVAFMSERLAQKEHEG